MAGTLMTEAQVGEAAKKAKKEGGDKKKEKEKVEKGPKHSMF